MLPSEVGSVTPQRWQDGKPVESGPNAASEVDRLRRELFEKEAELAQLRGASEPEGEDGEAPMYRLNSACFLGSSMRDFNVYPAGSVIEFWDTPNLEMHPLNDAARAKMAAYTAHLESCQAEVFAASGAGHGGGMIADLQEMLAYHMKEARRVAREGASRPIGEPVDTTGRVLPTQAHLAKRGPGRPRKVVREVAEVAEVAETLAFRVPA